MKWNLIWILLSPDATCFAFTSKEGTQSNDFIGFYYAESLIK